ncbi:uncharacterized protein LOC123516668 [Portunus trituberculatus]|uniref:uncharacterized protein LOC123516668 n=1 Tax=Portunus trituberculatus TaxID=210409 RepID=UPI001E1CFE61|nr:uncharacterized protein LOC123516668 [Portunus trituberculatus]
MTEDTETLKRQRTAARTKATKIIHDLRVLWNQKEKADADDLAYVINLAEDHFNRLKTVQEELDEHDVSDDSHHLKLRTFYNNPQYSNVEKFVHLKGHVIGEAAKCLQGLATTNDNYDVAVNLLNRRFGNEACRRESLMDSLLNTPRFKDGENLSQLLLPVLKSRIPESWRLQWARYKDSKKVSDSDLQGFLDFLDKEVTIRLESTQPPIGKYPSPAASPSAAAPITPRKSVTSVLSLQQQPTTVSKKDWVCKACNRGQHDLFKCQQYRKMSIDKRWAIVKSAGLCFQCLGPHNYRSCTSNKCPYCDNPHHSSLHRQDLRQLSPLATPYHPSQSHNILANHTFSEPRWKWIKSANAYDGCATSPGPTCEGVDITEHHQHLTEQRYNVTTSKFCYSSTALVVAVNGGHTRLVRLLIDGGSDSSYIRTSVAEALQFPITGSGTFACIGFQEKMEIQTYDQVRITLRGRYGGPSLDFNLWKTDHLCAPLPPRKLPSWPGLEEIQLADDFSAGNIDILIGTDQIYDVILWNQIPISKDLRAIETVFGYVVHGGTEISQLLPPRQSYYRKTVNSLWDLDSLGISDQEVSDVKKYPQPRWNENENRYEMDLAWRSDERPVTNLRSTKARTDKMSVRLYAKDLSEYDDHLASLYKSSIIEYAPRHQEPSAFFLPHRGIHRKDPRLRHMIERGIYMDDLCLTFPSVAEAHEGMEEVRRLFAAAGMELHKTQLTPACQEEVRKWWGDALNIREVPLPRCAGAFAEQSTTFCVFCDASQQAYCTAIYAVGSGESRLLVAKGRLVPLNPSLTIPRLELMAAFIGVKLMNTVSKALDLHPPTITYWSDSMDVICWIKSDKPLKLFVKNQVSSILEFSCREEWHHVSSLDNPADLGTRGISLSSLVSNSLWWKGPEFLLNPPVTPPPVCNEEDLELSETAKADLTSTNTIASKIVTTVTTEPNCDLPAGPFTLTNCSSLKQAVTRTAWIRRFCYNLRHPLEERKVGPLYPDERREALHFWIRLAQEKTYAADMDALRKGVLLPCHSSLSKVRPCLCTDELLRATLLTNEPLVIILPDLSYITTLIVDEAHRRCFHQSTEDCHTALRKDHYQNSERHLLEHKVVLDYFGQIYVDPGETKVWGLLITCAATRAVHLELASVIGPLVACVKKSLKITLHQCHLSYDELVATFCELAFHLNLRPLTSDNGEDAVTPAHFLFGVTSLQGVISPAVEPTTTLDRAWRNRRRISDHLNRRWTREYLQALRTWNTTPRGLLILESVKARP